MFVHVECFGWVISLMTLIHGAAVTNWAAARENAVEFSAGEQFHCFSFTPDQN